MKSYKEHFSQFLAGQPGRLHVAAHSHHLWPDVTRQAHLQAWTDAATFVDRKWTRVLSEQVPALRRRIAGILGLPDPDTLVFAPNTHELVCRLQSCLPTPTAILTTDGEFHSFARQALRWEEAGLARVERVPVAPLASFPDRFLGALRGGDHDLVYVSQVFFNSGSVLGPELLAAIAAEAPDRAAVAVDGYHGFMALPTDLSGIAGRVFYLAGGYKYAMSGEGVCFAHCPAGYGERPVNTGWFAGFTDLEKGGAGVGYEAGGQRFAGATFDPSGIYRMNAVLGWLDELGVTVDEIHARVQTLQAQLLVALGDIDHPVVRLANLVPGPDAPDRGHFLTFRSERAGDVHRALLEVDTLTDYRGDRLRFGFGLYHDPSDIDDLLERLEDTRDRL